MGIPNQKWNVRKENLTNTIDNLGANFRPTLRTACKEYIKKMNLTDIPKPAPPTVFDDSMVIVDQDEAAPAD